MTDEREQQVMRNAKAVLDRSVEELDQQTILRLQRMRVTTLTARPRSARWVLAGGLATMCAGILASVLWISKPAAVMPVHEADDLDVVTAAENLEFYDEIDFYRWLADHPGEG